MADDEVRRCVRHQLDAGVDVVVDGEQRRDSFYSFITEKVAGTRLMSLAEMLDTVEDKASFEEMLGTLDVPASAIKNPTCVGPISRREPLAVDVGDREIQPADLVAAVAGDRAGDARCLRRFW